MKEINMKETFEEIAVMKGKVFKKYVIGCRAPVATTAFNCAAALSARACASRACKATACSSASSSNTSKVFLRSSRPSRPANQPCDGVMV